MSAPKHIPQPNGVKSVLQSPLPASSLCLDSCSGDYPRSFEPNWAELLDPGKKFYGDQRIEGLYRMLFDNPCVYKAYYDLRRIPGVAHASAGVTARALPKVRPIDLALRAANQAAGMGLVKAHERALVHLAAIVSPCGLLLTTNNVEDDGKPVQPSWDEISLTRTHLLSRPLIKIKGIHVAMGNTLAAVLGQSYDLEDVDFDQVTRLATAVRLSDTTLASYWSGQISTAPRQGACH